MTTILTGGKPPRKKTRRLWEGDPRFSDANRKFVTPSNKWRRLWEGDPRFAKPSAKKAQEPSQTVSTKSQTPNTKTTVKPSKDKKPWQRLIARDADTLRVETRTPIKGTKGRHLGIFTKGGRLEKTDWVRLIGFNAPEEGFPYYKTGRKYLQSLIDKGEATPEGLEWGEGEHYGKYGRELKRARLKSGGYAGGKILDKGFAKVYTYKGSKNIRQKADYQFRELIAKLRQVGMWGKRKLP